MLKKAFRMKIFKGQETEYKRRHEAIWPEMIAMLQSHGAISYSIFLDEETSHLFGYLEIEDEEKWKEAAMTEINQKWWEHMADIMETNADNSPVSIELASVFEL